MVFVEVLAEINIGGCVVVELVVGFLDYVVFDQHDVFVTHFAKFIDVFVIHELFGNIDGFYHGCGYDLGVD